MDTNRCHRAGEDALESRGMAIALPDELQESVGPGSEGRVWQVGDLPANHRASGCALEARRTAIAMSDELQESVGLGTNRQFQILQLLHLRHLFHC